MTIFSDFGMKMFLSLSSEYIWIAYAYDLLGHKGSDLVLNLSLSF